MADSMCGPSNPLQNVQKHTAADRTLQQDRLFSRQSPSQGFRSASGPSANPEFEAFQAGALPLEHPFHQQGFAHAPPNIQPAGPSDWSSDFHRLRITSPTPQVQHPFGLQSQQRHDPQGWHQDFARLNPGVEQRMGQMPGQIGSQYGHSPMMTRNMTPQFAGGLSSPQAGMSIAQEKQPVEAFDEEAFARAFDEAQNAEMNSMENSTREMTKEVTQDQSQDFMTEELAEIYKSEHRIQSQGRIGADTIEDPRGQYGPQDPNALSRTAAELLDSVRHDQSNKFQNSQFLELMRQFRDKQATVEGDRIVGTSVNVNGEIDQEVVRQSWEEMIAIAKCIQQCQDECFDYTNSDFDVQHIMWLLLDGYTTVKNALGTIIESLYLNRHHRNLVDIACYNQDLLADIPARARYKDAFNHVVQRMPICTSTDATRVERLKEQLERFEVRKITQIGEYKQHEEHNQSSSVYNAGHHSPRELRDMAEESIGLVFDMNQA